MVAPAGGTASYNGQCGSMRHSTLGTFLPVSWCGALSASWCGKVASLLAHEPGRPALEPADAFTDRLVRRARPTDCAKDFARRRRLFRRKRGYHPLLHRRPERRVLLPQCGWPGNKVLREIAPLPADTTWGEVRYGASSELTIRSDFGIVLIPMGPRTAGRRLPRWSGCPSCSPPVGFIASQLMTAAPKMPGRRLLTMDGGCCRGPPTSRRESRTPHWSARHPVRAANAGTNCLFVQLSRLHHRPGRMGDFLLPADHLPPRRDRARIAAASGVGLNKTGAVW